MKASESAYDIVFRAEKQLTDEKKIIEMFRDHPDSIYFHQNWEGNKSFLGQNNGKGIVKSLDGVFTVQ